MRDSQFVAGFKLGLWASMMIATRMKQQGKGLKDFRKLAEAFEAEKRGNE